MTLSREFESSADVQIEQEPRSKVLITFQGHTHSPDNLQGIHIVIDALRNHLQQSQGEKVVFHESGIGTSLSSTSLSDLAHPNDLLGPLGGFHRFIAVGNLIKSSGQMRMPSDSDINDHIQLIASKSLREILAEGLITEEMIQIYFLAQEMDALKVQMPYTDQFEYHSKEVYRNSARYVQEAKQLAEISEEQWVQRDFAGAIKSSKAGYRAHWICSGMRDRDNVDYMRRKVKEFSKSRDGGSVFSLFGAAHYTQITELGKRLDLRHNSLRLQSNLDKILTSPARALAVRLGTPEATDLDYARGFLHEALFKRVRATAVEAGQLVEYMQHYMDIDEGIMEFLGELSFDEIRRICEQQNYDVFFNDGVFIRRVITCLD